MTSAILPEPGRRFAAVVALTLLLTAGLTAVPTRLEARRPVADVLRDS